MVELDVASGVGEDAIAREGDEVIGDSDGAGDRAALQLLQHCVGPVHEAVLVNAVLDELALVEARTNLSSVGAVHALVDGLARVSNIVASGSIKLAGFGDDIVLVNVLVCGDGVSTVAAVVG